MNTKKRRILNSLLFIIGLTMIPASYAKSYRKNCFTEHILESININKERKEYYSEITGGESDRIFNLLIGYEYLTLLPAKYFDLLARPFQKKQMELFCHEFMSMNHTTDFDPKMRINPTYAFKEFHWREYKSRLSSAIKRDDIESVRALTVQALLELKEMPDYYCMTRHMLESIYRFAYFIPIREKEAKELKIKNPRKLLKNVMATHLLGMRDTYKIDHWSYPIQKSGIPLLCSELPHLLFDLKAPELELLQQGVE